MSNRSKKNRRAKLAIPQQAAKRRSPRLAVVFLAAAIVLPLGIWWWKIESANISPAAKSLTVANAAYPSTADRISEFQKLTGPWQRPDGGYVLAIKSIADNGAMEAVYYNPNRINIATAEASKDGDAMKVFIELRDVNYPGSTYRLTYDPASDQLKGIYYQAIEKQRFPVVFVRMR
jgi:uncharacterized protein (DUF2147 family)